jgi:dihydropyrimidinase
MHNEKPYIIQESTTKIRKQVEEEGRDPVLEDWTTARPSVAEYGALISNINLAQAAGKCPFYGVHTSPKESVDYFAECKEKGLEVYCEVVSHHIIFNKHSRFKNDPNGWFGLTIVPLRDREDQDRLWEGINEGIVDCYGSDHVEGIPGQKAIMWDRDFGNSEVEIHYPCMLSEGVNKNRISINKLVEIAAENPAKVFGLYPQKGTLSVGADADMVIVDLNEEKTISYDLFPTLKDSITLYEGMSLKGWPITTFVRGNVVMENGKITAKMGTGRYLKHKYSGYLRH